MWANTEGTGEIVRLRRLAWAFAFRLCDKYTTLTTWEWGDLKSDERTYFICEKG